MRRFSAFALLLGFSLGSALQAQTVPRPSPEFVIAPANAKPILLSSLRGKVVILEFLFTTCIHCQHEAQLLSKLNTEYGTHGLQVLGVAINGNVLPGLQASVVADFVKENHANFPIAYGDRDQALNYLGISPVERWGVPQLVIIDRKGVIRAQTPPPSDVKFQQEDWLRSQIEMLLKEPTAKRAPAAATKKRST